MIDKIVSATAREDVKRGINEYLRLGYQPDGNLVHSKNNHNILSNRMIKLDKNNTVNNLIKKCELVSNVRREDVEGWIDKCLRQEFEPYENLISSRAVRYRKEMSHLTILMVKRENINKTIKKCKIISETERYFFAQKRIISKGKSIAKSSQNSCHIKENVDF